PPCRQVEALARGRRAGPCFESSSSLGLQKNPAFDEAFCLDTHWSRQSSFFAHRGPVVDSRQSRLREDREMQTCLPTPEENGESMDQVVPRTRDRPWQMSAARSTPDRITRAPD